MSSTSIVIGIYIYIMCCNGTVVGLEPLNLVLINTEMHRSRNEYVSEETKRSARQLVGKGWNTYLLLFAFFHIFVFI
jgi:hypothetical protein